MNTIYFRGNDGELQLAKDLRRNGIEGKADKGVQRFAPMFDGNVENCSTVVLLPGVTEHDAKRIAAAYHAISIPVYRLQDLMDGPPPEAAPKPAIEVPPPLAPSASPLAPKTALSNAHLRRMPTGQLRDIASGCGVDISTAQDRATLIAAIEAAAQKGANTP